MSRSHSRWLAAFVVFVLALLAILDQSLKSIWVTRPVAEIGQMIEITGGDAAPYYRLRAGADTHYTRWRNPDAVTRVRINALGMRGDEYNLERRPGVQRIVAIGDSMTFGIAVEAEEALPAQLEKLLRQRGHDVEVWNAGTPGHQMEDYLGTLRRILPLAQPDVVVLGLTGGDEVAPYPISNTLLKAMSYSGLARAYFMLRLATGADPDRFVALYETFLDEAQAADAAVVVWSESDFGSRLDDEITRISAQYAVVYLALHEKRLPQFDDDPHYTPEGNRLAAEQLLPAVRAAID